MNAKEYLSICDKKGVAWRLRENFLCTYQSGDKVPAEITEAEALVKMIEHTIEELPKTSVSFMIGYRSYYQDVIKIGKSYFSGHTKMTKSNGFRNIEEIPEITEEMKNDMISDSHWY